MSTWNEIIIENPGELTLETLPDCFKADGEIWQDRSEDDERVTTPARRALFQPIDTPREKWLHEERRGVPEGRICIEGRSKYMAEDVGSWMAELSKGRRITWHQSWDDDDEGQSLDVWENGERVTRESAHSEMVTDDINDLVQAVRDALDARVIKRTDHDGTVTHPIEDAARALVDALRPPPNRWQVVTEPLLPDGRAAAWPLVVRKGDQYTRTNNGHGRIIRYSDHTAAQRVADQLNALAALPGS